MTDAEIQALIDQIAAQTEAISRLTDSLNRQSKPSGSTSDVSGFAKNSADAVYAAQKKQAAMLESFLSKTAAKVSRSFEAVEKAGEKAADDATRRAGPIHPDRMEKVRQSAKQKGRQDDPAFNKVSLMMTTFGAGLSGLSVGAKQFSSQLKSGTLSAGGMASSFGSVVGAVTNVTKNLGPWGLALSTTAQALAGLAGVAARQGDAQANVFETLATSGANTVGGLTDINFMLNKFGLSTEQAAKATALIAANAPALALLGGTVAEGTKVFANVSKVIGDSGLRKELKLLGIGYDAQRESMAAFLAIQGRTGSGQKKTFEQLAVSAAAYMKEQDAVTRATGVTAKEQQASQARALNEEMFRTRQNKLRLRGEDDLANKELEVYSTIEAFSGKDVAIQFGAMMDGVLNDANKGLQMLTGGRAYTIAQDQSLSGAEKAKQLNEAIKEGLASQGQTVGSIGNFQKEYNIGLGQVSDKVLGTIKTPEERLAAGTGQQVDLITTPSKGVKSSVETAENVLKSMRDFENAVQIGVDGMQTFGEKLSAFANRITKLLPEKTAKGDSTGEQILDGMSSAFDIATAPFLGPFKLLGNLLSGGGFAEGGVAEGPKSGYLALLHGKEQITPWDQIVKRQDDKTMGTDTDQLMDMMLKESMSGLANITGAKSAGKGEVGSGPAFSKVTELSALMEKVVVGIDKSNMYLKDILDEITGGATVGGANMTAAMNAHDKGHQHEPPTVTPEAAQQLGKGLGSPLEDLKVTSGFGMRIDPITGKQAGHGGVDLAGRAGDAIKAPEAGIARVVSEAASGGYGNMVEILDSQGKVMHRMAHMSETMVKTGDKIEAGAQIGKVGSTGRSTGNHLHWEKFDPTTGMQVDPMAWLAQQQGKTPGFGTTGGGAATGNPQAARRGQKYGAPQMPNAAGTPGAPTDMATYMKTVAMLESGGDPNAKAGTSNGNYSSAGGLFQFLESSYEGVTGRKGSGAERFDPAKATEAMQKLTMMNKGQMEKGLGREVSGEDLYMGHFLGAGGATKFLQAKDKDPNQSAAKFDPTAAASNKSIYYDQKDNNRERSMAEVHNLMTEKYRKQQAAIQSGQKLPDVVAALGTGGMPLAGAAAPTAAPPVVAAPTAAPPVVAGVAPPVTGFTPGAQAQPAQQPTTIAGMAQNILGSIFGGGTTAPSGMAGPTLPGPSTDMSAITQALQAQTTATQSAITSSMENMTNRLVESLGTAGGGGAGVAGAEVPALLGDIVSAQREQTAAINRLISVQTA